MAAIVAEVRAGGDDAVLTLTERFDRAELGPGELRVDANELESSVGVLEPDVLAGLRTAVANVREVAAAQLREPVGVRLPEGQTVEVAELPMRRAGVYVPGGRAPYPSTVVMCAVTARAAGVEEIAVCAPPGPGGRPHPVILAACVLCGVTEVYRMGGAQAIAALAWGTESVAPVDVIVGPGNAYVQEAKRQAAGQVGIDGVAGPSELVVVASDGADPELVALDLLAQAEHGDDSLLWCISPDPALLDAVGAAVERLAAGRPSVTDAELQLIEAGDARAAVRWPTRSPPSTSSSWATEAEALADRVRRAGCLFVGPRRRHGLRRLRGRLEPRASHRGRGALRVGAVPGDLPAPDGARILAPRGGSPSRARRRRPGPRRGLSRTRRVDGAPGVSRSAEIHRTTNETDVELRLDLDGAGAGERTTGVGFFDHLLDALARHGGMDLTCAWRATSRPAPTTPWRTPASRSGRRSTRRWPTAPESARFGHAVIPMDEARASCAIDISGRPFLVFEGSYPDGGSATSTPTWPRSSSARWPAPPS